MTGLVRKAILLSVCGLLFAGAAMASVPSAATSTIPVGIILVGTDAGGTIPDAFGTFTVTVRDLASNPIANSSVVVDFSLCGPDMRYSSPQPGGYTVECISSKSVRTLTNGSGVATFMIVGGSANLGVGVFSPMSAGKIFADGVLLGNITVSSLDHDLAGGAGANDRSLIAADFFASIACGRSDLDFSGGIGANDLSRFGAAFFASGSSATGLGLCTP